MGKNTKNIAKKMLLFIAGSVVLVAGITAVLAWWSDVVVVFRGIAGMVVALTGMLILYMIKE